MPVTAFFATRRKALFALIGVILAWGPVAQIDGFQARDWWTLAAGIAGVFGVHEVTNADSRQPVTNWGKEGGYGDIVSIVVIIILLLIVCRIFGLL